MERANAGLRRQFYRQFSLLLLNSWFDLGKVKNMGQVFLDVDPRQLRVTSPRVVADPAKLHRQIAQFGKSTAGMPRIWAYEGSDGALVITNGVTRATRVAKLQPGTLVPVEIVGNVRRKCGHLPKIGDLLP
jgi:hypothetical protein